MVTFAIIICTLFIAFFEKPHLFQRPIKAEKVIIILLLLGTASFSFFKENQNNKQQNRLEDSVAHLNGYNRALIIQSDAFRNENRGLHAEHQDSLKKFHYTTVDILAKYGYKVDTMNDRIIRLDAASMADPPGVVVYPKEITDEKTGIGIKYSIQIRNQGGSNAYRVALRTFSVLDYNGALYPTRQGMGVIAKTFISNKQEVVGATPEMATSLDVDKCSKYFLIEGEYFDAKGKEYYYFSIFGSLVDKKEWLDYTGTTYGKRIEDYLKREHIIK